MDVDHSLVVEPPLVRKSMISLTVEPPLARKSMISNEDFDDLLA